MVFYALYNKGWRTGIIVTDDYELDEIARGDHIKHIKQDLKTIGYYGTVKVFDINHKLVKVINRAA